MDRFVGVMAAAANLTDTTERGSYTAKIFLSDFPQFTDSGEEEKKGLVPEVLLQTFIDNANKSVLPSRWADMWRYAAGLFVAHYATLYLKTYSDGSVNAAQAAAAGQSIGSVKSATMGDTSISYDSAALTAGTEKWGTWNATQYGQQLVTMARMVGMGGMYVI